MVLPLGYALLFLRFGQALVKLLRGEEVHLVGDEAEEAIRQGEADLRGGDGRA